MPTINSNEFTNVTGVANYPNDTGVRFGLQSQTQANFYPVRLMNVNLMTAGTWGSGAAATVQVQDRLGSWVPTSIAVSGAGQESGIVEGCSVRVAADPGSGPGTGANAPRLFLGIEDLNYTQTGEYAG